MLRPPSEETDNPSKSRTPRQIAPTHAPRQLQTKASLIPSSLHPPIRRQSRPPSPIYTCHAPSQPSSSLHSSQFTVHTPLDQKLHSFVIQHSASSSSSLDRLAPTRVRAPVKPIRQHERKDAIPSRVELGVLHARRHDGGRGGDRGTFDGPAGASGEAGVGERGGDIQREQLLHVPRREEALQRDGGEPGGARARPGPEWEGDGAGAGPAARELWGRPGHARRVHRREADRRHGPGHGLPHQRDFGAAPQGSRRTLALNSSV